MLTSKVGIRVFAAGAVSLAALLVAQNPVGNRATLYGTVTDAAAGAAIPEASVEAEPQPAGKALMTTSDEVGKYKLNLPPGTYNIKVIRAGFKLRHARITLTPGARKEYNVTLEVGSMAESVTVTSAAPQVVGPNQRGPGVPPQPPPPPPKDVAEYDLFRSEPRVMSGGVLGGIITRAAPPPNTEQYDHLPANAPQLTRTQPLSTFAVDVDTASYSNVRRFLNQGQLPPPNAVRIEELVNYFQYNYSAPEPGKPVSMTAVLTDCPWNPARQLLQIGVRTKPIANRDLPPSNLTFLIDVSGSMNEPAKLPLVQQALRMLVRELRPQDHVAMVVYAGNAGTVLEPTPGDQKDRILDAINSLQAGGSTHGSRGIRAAYEMAHRAFHKGGSNRVILATDGDFNVGVTSDDELIQLIEHERTSGLFLSVLGFGTGNLKDSKMEKLADHGNGAYAYIDSLSEARRVFVEQTGATLVTVAKDVKLQIEFNPENVNAWRLVGYENRLLRDEEFNDDSKDAGDMGAGHQVTALYEITPINGSTGVDDLRYQNRQPEAAFKSGKSAELAWLKLRWKKPDANESAKLEWPISSKPIRFADTPADTRFAAAVAEYGLLLSHSPYAPQASFDHAVETARHAVGDDAEGHRAEFTVLARKARDLSVDLTASGDHR